MTSTVAPTTTDPRQPTCRPQPPNPTPGVPLGLRIVEAVRGWAQFGLAFGAAR